MEFLANNWKNIVFAIIVIIVLIIGVMWFIKSYKKDKEKTMKQLSELLLKLVTHAEKYIKGNKVGKERYAQVLQKVYDWLPNFIKFFVTKELLDDMIEEALTEAKAKWKKYPALLNIETPDDEILKVTNGSGGVNG